MKRALLRRFPGPRFRCRLRACSSSLTSCASDTRVNYSPRQQPQVARAAYYKTPKLNSKPRAGYSCVVVREPCPWNMGPAWSQDNHLIPP